MRDLHSEIEMLDRVTILTDLRMGEFDVLVGVNLLREGLDLPEVSLVCILDADKEGFSLRSGTSLIQQIMGCAARNANSLVIMYADKMTPAMQSAIEETERRRVKQVAYNELHGMTPTTIIKGIRGGMEGMLKGRKAAREAVQGGEPEYEIDELLKTMDEEMRSAASALHFEKAAILLRRSDRQAQEAAKMRSQLADRPKDGARKCRTRPRAASSPRVERACREFGPTNVQRRAAIVIAGDEAV